MKTISPDEILENARRRVEHSERRRYLTLFIGIGLFVVQIGFSAFLIEDPEGHFQFTESFLWGLFFGVFFIILSSPCAMCIVLFLRKYDYEYILSKRLIELEEERLRENKS
jgi:hypothetical protein